MRRIWVPPALFAALTIQAAVWPSLFPGKVRPDLVLVLAIVVSLTRGTVAGVVTALVGGLFQDAMTGQFIGANAGADMAVAALVGFWEPRLFRENLFTPGVVIVAGTVLREAIYLFIVGSFGAHVDLGRAVLVVMPWMASLNCVAGIWLYHRVYLRPRNRARPYARVSEV
ncbi:MAG: rod shape-determining protein MreD [Firmicutes bacterium]|jgi:rod shape-determining protein MreD|nr:rod shape-determining protein MreD [Bacillota bacterium]